MHLLNAMLFSKCHAVFQMSNRMITLAQHFQSSRVKKRFLKQMIPLQKLLKAHGMQAFFPIPTLLHIINDQGQTIVVGLEDGERRFQDTEQIFCVFNADEMILETPAYYVRVNQMRGIIRTLVRWEMMGEHIIDESEIECAEMEGHMQCDGCGRKQVCMTMERFKQCRLCHDKEKTQIFPEYRGFYCGKECQREHWRVHKHIFHTGSSTCLTSHHDHNHHTTTSSITWPQASSETMDGFLPPQGAPPPLACCW